MSTDPMEFAGRVGAELSRMLGDKCRAELLALKQEEQFGAAVGASLVCLAEVLREPVSRGVPPATLIALCSSQLETLLAPVARPTPAEQPRSQPIPPQGQTKGSGPVLAEPVKVVRYPSSNPWVGKVICKACQHTAHGWRSSGMSDCYPHFYCTRCSNAIQREQDKEAIFQDKSEAVLGKIAATLPGCPCGGHFAPGANPKCPACNAEFSHQRTPFQRLDDPHVILLDGAAFFGEVEPYRVKIDEG